MLVLVCCLIYKVLLSWPFLSVVRPVIKLFTKELFRSLSSRSREQLVYITTLSSVCQHLFSSFFEALSRFQNSRNQHADQTFWGCVRCLPTAWDRYYHTPTPLSTLFFQFLLKKEKALKRLLRLVIYTSIITFWLHLFIPIRLHT